MVVYEASQVWLVNVTVDITSGFAAISSFDKSDVHIVNGLIERPADTNFYAGIFASSGHVTMQGTVIRDMQQSINIDASGSVDLVYFDASVPARDVMINNPAGTNSNGVRVTNGSSLNTVSSIKLRITKRRAALWIGHFSGLCFRRIDFERRLESRGVRQSRSGSICGQQFARDLSRLYDHWRQPRRPGRGQSVDGGRDAEHSANIDQRQRLRHILRFQVADRRQPEHHRCN